MTDQIVGDSDMAAVAAGIASAAYCWATLSGQHVLREVFAGEDRQGREIYELACRCGLRPTPEEARRFPAQDYPQPFDERTAEQSNPLMYFDGTKR